MGWPRDERLGRLIGALRRAGYDVTDLELGRGASFRLHDLKRGDVVPVRVEIAPLGRELLHPRSRRAHVVPPEPSSTRAPAQGLDLVLGYEPGFDAFVAWQPEARRGAEGAGAAFRVPTGRLAEARDRGVGVDVRPPAARGRQAEIVTAIRPDRVREYLEAVPELRALRRELEAGGHEAVPGIRRATFHALGTTPPALRPAALGVIESAKVPKAPEAPSPPGSGRAAPPSRSAPQPPRSASPPPSPEGPEPRPAREVGTGFATPEGAPVSVGPLLPDSPYLFWFKVGDPVPYSIEQTPTEVPIELLPAEAELDVVVFGFEGELELDPEADVGRLRIDRDGGLHVRVAVASPRSPDPALSGSLFFPLRTPDREGTARLRCNVYCEGVLVQSRLVSALVARDEASLQTGDVVLASELEYSLSRSLHSAQLAKLPAADLSLMMNGDRDRHQFRLYAPGDDVSPVITSSATVEASELTKSIEYCRAGLRKASWGDEGEWKEGVPPKYSAVGSPDQLEADLLDLAIRGRLAYTAIIDRLVEDREVRRELQGIRYHARIELAAAPERFVPAALFYDAPLAPGANLSELTLCGEFVAAREDPDVALEDCPCLNGSCPGWEEKTIVCPGGFWGFRHAMGWPVSLDDGDALGVLACESSLRAAMASADDLAGAAQHREDVRGLLHDLDDASDLAQLLKLLAAHRDQLVYLYCHGGETPGKVPFVRIGDPQGPRLTRGEIFELDLEGRSALVFLNGCTTTAVSPESQFDLVDAFIQYGGAVGVIGTEITVFEPMAAPFALDFLEAFVGGRATVGEAIRHARLAALKRGNPLGLAYVPFVLGGMKLEAVGAEADAQLPQGAP